MPLGGSPKAFFLFFPKHGVDLSEARHYNAVVENIKILMAEDYPQISGLSPFASALMGYNGIDAGNFFAMLPDTKKEYDFSEWLAIEEHMPEEKAFSDFVLSHPDLRWCVIGDYDCDGIMATSIAAFALRYSKRRCSIIIPNRFSDGYGMSKKHVEAALAKGADAIMTVDNGISCSDEVSFAKASGASVVVTDHHLAQGSVPKADVVADPFCDGMSFSGISGATVALKLCLRLLQDGGEEFGEAFNDLCSLAAITVLSDSMPMLGENRILVKAALGYLNSREGDPDSFPHKLADMLGYYEFPPSQRILRRFTDSGLQFSLIPVVNAVNRIMGDPSMLVDDILLILSGGSPDKAVGDRYAAINAERKLLKKSLMEQYSPSGAPVELAVLRSDPDANCSGMAGLLASSIAESEGKPALVGIDDPRSEKIKLSGRSVGGFSLYDAISEVAAAHPEMGIDFGGHDEALGCAVRREYAPEFGEAVSAMAASMGLKTREREAILLRDVGDAMKAFSDFGPYGKGFRFPDMLVSGHLLGGPSGFDRTTRTVCFDSLPNARVKCYDKALFEHLRSVWLNDPESTSIAAVCSMSDGDYGPSLDLRSIASEVGPGAADLRGYSFDSSERKR
jgi:single-stranded-DNA-specific exonuclease